MKKAAATFLLIFTFLAAFAQIPDAPNPPRLVNDLAHVLTQPQIRELEQRLVAFNDSTSNVICVVTVNSLNDMTAEEFAYEIGDKWGVRSKDKNNGVVILIKPKTDTKGEVRIEVGYDLEGVLPDIVANDIANDTMIPYFKNNDYYGGINAALNTILSIVAGEISYKRYEKDDTGELIAAIAIIVFIMLFVFILLGGNRNKGNGNDNNNRRNVWKWLFLLSLLSNSSRGNNNNNNSNNNGGFGGSYGGGYDGGFGGGFGGFGGRGGFGGGGGGGSW